MACVHAGRVGQSVGNRCKDGRLPPLARSTHAIGKAFPTTVRRAVLARQITGALVHPHAE
jgi:hypothetical protein